VHNPYWQSFHALRGVYLEGSPVLSVDVYPGALVFGLLVLLTPVHPAYQPLEAADGHHFRPGRLRLSGDRVRLERDESPGELGFITTWAVDERGISVLAGGWGTASLVCLRAELQLQR
jgi:hypothetical protein